MDVSTYPRTQSISMPVAGTLIAVPNLGSLGLAQGDAVTWPGPSQNDFEVKPNEDRLRATYRTEAFGQDAMRLSRELQERKAALSAFRGDDRLLSRHAIEDPFQTQPLDARSPLRVRQAKDMLQSVLMSDAILALVDAVPVEPFPSLEARIRATLDSKAVSLCAGLLDLSFGSTSALAASVLAEKLRFLNDVQVPEIQNPSNPFQTLAINDPVLLAGHEVTSSVEEFKTLAETYLQASRSYWTKVGEKKLYSDYDIAFLKTWKVIGNLAADPIDLKLDAASAGLAKMQDLFQQNFAMVATIAHIGFDHFLHSTWPVLDPLDADARGRYLAKEAAARLGLAPAVADGHVITWSRVRQFTVKYFLLDLGKPIDQGLETTDLWAPLVSRVAFESATHVVSTMMEFKASNLWGNTKFRLNFLEIPQDMEATLNVPELNEGQKIIHAAMQNPRNSREYIQNVRAWRRDFMLALAPKRINDPQRIVDKYERLVDVATDSIERLELMQEHVARINELQGVLRAMFDRLNSGSIYEGNIDVPFDWKVTSVFAAPGEHIMDGRPVMAATDRFRCSARAFLTPAAMAALRLTVLSVWQVKIDGNTEIAPGISIIAVVSSATPDRDDLWVLDFDVMAAVHVAVPGAVNLPSFLPLSSRYLGVHDSVTEESMVMVEGFMITQAARTLDLVSRVH